MIDRDYIHSKRVIAMRGEKQSSFPLQFEQLTPQAQVKYLQILQDNNLDVWYEIITTKRFPAPGREEASISYAANDPRRSSIECMGWALPPDDETLVELILVYERINDEVSQFQELVGPKIPTLPEAPTPRLVDRHSDEYKEYIENRYIGDLMHPPESNLADMTDEEFIRTVGHFGVSVDDGREILRSLDEAE